MHDQWYGLGSAWHGRVRRRRASCSVQKGKTDFSGKESRVLHVRRWRNPNTGFASLSTAPRSDPHGGTRGGLTRTAGRVPQRIPPSADPPASGCPAPVWPRRADDGKVRPCRKRPGLRARRKLIPCWRLPRAPEAPGLGDPPHERPPLARDEGRRSPRRLSSPAAACMRR